MKKLISSLLLAAVFVSCGLFDKAEDFSFSTKQVMEILVSETQTSATGKDYETTKTLQLSEDKEVSPYLDALSDLKIDKITYQISNYAPAGKNIAFLSGTLSSGTTVGTASNFALSTSTKETEFKLNIDGATALAKKLKESKSAELKIAGNLSETPVSFTMTVTVYYTVYVSM